MPSSVYFMELGSPGVGAFIFRIVMDFGWVVSLDQYEMAFISYY